MRAAKLNSRYFDWMCQLVCDNEHTDGLSRQKLLTRLHNTAFTYILDMDANRAEDGADLRFKFGYESKLKRSTVERYLNDSPCSVLEMMIALAIHEENIMSNPETGDRTGRWFWNMVDNLGLGDMNDENFNPEKVDKIIDRFLKREYEKDGKGGLFSVGNARFDLRTVEIWYQAMWYLDGFMKNEGG